MPIYFNTVLKQADIPIDQTRLLRHRDTRADVAKTPYELWRDDRPAFELYQSLQKFDDRTKLGAKYWASFVGDPNGQTIFVGIYQVKSRGVLEQDIIMPHNNKIAKAGDRDVYELAIDERLMDLDGLMLIEWGVGARAWIQRADSKDKPVVELRKSLVEPPFPGFTSFVETLSRIERLPRGWQEALRATRGTKEQYVGSASGGDGFFGRWLQYVRTDHGGNVGLKSREPSDYQVSILEVVGSTLSDAEILDLESLWKKKLQSLEMGLNRN